MKTFALVALLFSFAVSADVVLDIDYHDNAGLTWLQKLKISLDQKQTVKVNEETEAEVTVSEKHSEKKDMRQDLFIVDVKIFKLKAGVREPGSSAKVVVKSGQEASIEKSADAERQKPQMVMKIRASKI